MWKVHEISNPRKQTKKSQLLPGRWAKPGACVSCKCQGSYKTSYLSSIKASSRNASTKISALKENVEQRYCGRRLTREAEHTHSKSLAIATLNPANHGVTRTRASHLPLNYSLSRRSLPQTRCKNINLKKTTTLPEGKGRVTEKLCLETDC